MERKRKEHIDSLWMKTDLGQFVLASASGKKVEAETIQKKVLSRFPFSFTPMEKELSEKIAAELKDATEWEAYLKALDTEDPDLFEFMISDDTFGYVYGLLKEKN